MLAAASHSLSEGQILLSKYRVDAVLGIGGMGVVVRATHLQLDERVAIKVLRNDAMDDEARERFLREARAAGRLRSEHIARVTDVGTLDNGEPYMVMEYLEGTDLASILQRTGRLPPARACEFLLQACVGLAEAHRHGIVHRDLKPANLYVCERSDGTPLLKVLDFGVSKRSSEDDLRLTQAQALLGTPAYMSPEQMRAATSVDARTDLWSLGVILYELLEGRLPFWGDNLIELVLNVSNDPMAPLTSSTPPGLDRVITRCLAKAPDGRYSTVTALAVDLAQFVQDPVAAGRTVAQIARILRDEATPVPSFAAPVIAERPSRSPPRFAVVVGVALSVVGIAVAAYAFGGHASNRETAPRDEGSTQAATPPDAGTLLDSTSIVRADASSASVPVDAAGEQPTTPIPDAPSKNPVPNNGRRKPSGGSNARPDPPVGKGSSDVFDTYQLGKPSPPS